MTLTEILPAVRQLCPEGVQLIRCGKRSFRLVALRWSLLAYLVLSSNWADAAVVKGRVVDSAGQRVANAEIRIWRKTRPANVPIGQNEPLTFDGTPLRTDAAGRFATPDVANLGQAVRVVTLAEGMLAARSDWVVTGEQTVVVPDMIPRRLRSVEGRVTGAGVGVERLRALGTGGLLAAKLITIGSITADPQRRP
ncbi:MAG TPA: hypothetical protein VND64_21820 [Pirellulales bacterium]|nr:hypothetical protein [Pirellulales bacterium]